MYNVSKALSVQSCTVNRSETRLLIVKCAYRLFPKFLPFLTFRTLCFMKPCTSHKPCLQFFRWSFSVSCMSPFTAEATFQFCLFLKYYKHINCSLQNQSEITKSDFFLNNDLFVILRSFVWKRSVNFDA